MTAGKDTSKVYLLPMKLIHHMHDRIMQNILIMDNNERSEHLYCWKSDLSLSRTGYPKSLRVTNQVKKQAVLEENWEEDIHFPPNSYNWPASWIVLIEQGLYPISDDQEGSHLCNNPWCVRPSHIIWEVPDKNYSRKNCMTWIACPCGCKNEWNPCKHNPQCLPIRK